MASSVSGVGSRTPSSITPPAAGGSGDRTRSQTVTPVREKTGVGPRDSNEREYVHWEGRRFDLNAPRGTYLNIVI
jgi:hypothetical protein